MPDIASVLKAEISRIARKELKQETTPLRKALTTQRAEIAALKRKVAEQDKELKGLKRGADKSARTVPAKDEPPLKVRFSAKRLAAQRAKLGLSANDFGRLIGASGQSVYNWEAGDARPSAKYIAAIAGVRGIGRREVQARMGEAA